MKYKDKIFEMLGVECGEKFKLNVGGDSFYSIDEDFVLWYEYTTGKGHIKSMSDYSVLDILCDPSIEIMKLPKKVEPTAQQQIAIDYARALGAKWLAKDSDGDVYAYKTKPVKKRSDSSYGYWHAEDYDEDCGFTIEIPLDFLSFEDKEPYYIGEEEPDSFF